MHISKPGGPVVVVGSLHHDIVVRADRQPARGETLMGHEWFPKFGGKGGNQAVAAARLGAETYMIGAVGRDTFGDDLIAGLKAAGVDHSLIERVETGSGMSVAMVDGQGDYAAVVVTGANAAIRADAIADAEMLGRASVLLLQNEVPSAINLAAAKAAHQAGATVLWNAAPMRPDEDGLLELVDLLIVNAVEAEQFCGLPVGSLPEAETAARKLCDPGTSVVVTAGAAGCAWSTKEGDTGSIPAEPVQNAQAHGAGDVFCGALAARLTTASLAECIHFASSCAHRHVSGLPL
ncbi:MAG: ribokinase [Pseudomonadota bacterium]